MQRGWPESDVVLRKKVSFVEISHVKEEKARMEGVSVDEKKAHKEVVCERKNM